MDDRGRRNRIGPETRAQARATSLDDRRRRWAHRQRRCRAIRTRVEGEGAEDEEAQEYTHGDPLRWGCTRHRSSVWRSAQGIATTLIRSLSPIENPAFRAAVLDKVFSNPRVRQLLPDYYPTPEEARTQREILRNIRYDLLALKVPYSSGMLARKRSILEAVVGEADSNFTKFHAILGTRKQNLVSASNRLRSSAEASEPRYHVPSRKKREGGVSEEVRLFVIEWWTEETRVSPGRRDVRRKRLGRNVYDTHAAHLLLETQVHWTEPRSFFVTDPSSFLFISTLLKSLLQFRNTSFS